jgi:hypothetical protein
MKWVLLPGCLTHLKNYICTNFVSVTQTPAEVIAELREMMERGQPPPPTPYSLRRFFQAMLGMIARERSVVDIKLPQRILSG